MSMDISIIVPLYNEEESIEKLYRALVPVLIRLKKSYEIIFIDDGSTDKSFEILTKLADKDPTIKIIKFAQNFGQTAALLAGFKSAKGNLIVSIDADLQNDPEDIPNLIKKLNDGYDVVCGWRVDRQDPLSKKLPSKLSNWLMRKLLGLDIHDFGCTLRVYRKEVIQNINIYGETHRYIPAIISNQGFKVTEEKVHHMKRMHGKTKYGISRLPKGFLHILALKFLTTYGSRPIHIFGGIGLLSSLLGFLGGLVLLYDKFVKGLSIGSRPLLILVALLIIIGVQFIMNGLIAELLIRQRENLSTTYWIEKVVQKK